MGIVIGLPINTIVNRVLVVLDSFEARKEKVQQVQALMDGCFKRNFLLLFNQKLHLFSHSRAAAFEVIDE